MEWDGKCKGKFLVMFRGIEKEWNERGIKRKMNGKFSKILEGMESGMEWNGKWKGNFLYLF